MYFRLHFIAILIILFSLFIISCGGGTEGTDKPICNYGDIKICTCDDGSNGKQICKDNAWQSCQCSTNELCKNITCSGAGKCIVRNETAVCECKEGYHAEELNCIKDGEVNPCESVSCQDNSNCIVETGEAKCICNHGYIPDNNGKCIYRCPENSHANENNDGCDCNNGFHSENNECVEDDNFKCLDFICDDENSHCIIENEEPVCTCNDGFKADINNICIIDCSSVENSRPDDDNSKCICENNYHFENSLCISNSKMVPCTAITPPENAHQIEENVLIEWTEDGWTTPTECIWECNTGYQDNDHNNTCELSCSESACEHASCNDSSGKIDCICDEGYQDNDNDEICLPNCASTEVNGIECGGQGICDDDTGIIFCICEDGYQDNDHNGTCEEKCHIDILAPELSTCGRYGTCSDSSGTITCTCEDGYFVDSDTGKCIAPCENIDCGKHGTCVALGINNISCSCDGGYQDNNNNLICKKSCDSSCLTNSTDCSDDTGELLCQCNTGYQDNDRDGTCLPDCSAVTCDLTGQIPDSCSDNSGFAVCSYEHGYNYTYVVQGENEQQINDSVLDSNANLYIAGSFKGSVDFDPTNGTDIRNSSGDEDIFITRINADGSYGWTYSIGAYSLDGAQSLAVDEYDNIYITGYFSSTVDFDPSSSSSLMRSEGYRDIFILKLTKYGEFVWSQSIMSRETEMATSIKLDSSSIYLTGYLQGDNNSVVTVDFDKTSNAGNFEVKGRRDGFIAKFNINNGSYIWAKVFGVSGMTNSAQDVVILENELIITGFIYGDNIDFDEGNAAQGLISTNNKSEAFILKLSKNNEFIWIKALEPETSMDVSKGVKLENLNNSVFLIGNLTGNIDFDTGTDEDMVNAGDYSGIYISRIDSDGQIQDKEIFISSGSPSVIKDTAVYNSKLYLTGDIGGSLNIHGTTITNSSSTYNENDVFFVTLDETLNVQNINIFGGLSDDTSKTVSVGSNGEIYIGGEFTGTCDFDPSASVDSKTSLGMKDIFVSRFTD